MPVTEVFQDIIEDVYHKRRRKLRPFSMNGIAEHGPIYLNKVPSCTYSIKINLFLSLHSDDQNDQVV